MEFRHTDKSALEEYFKHTFEKKLLLYMPQREKEHLTPSTQTLEKMRELEEVEKARKAEKEEFRMKMESLASRRDEIEIRENQLKESLLKFDTFIKENDAKLSRAMNKTRRERDAVNQCEVEIESCLEYKAELNQEMEKLQETVQRYSKYDTFLRKVMAEGGGYDEPRAVIIRHKTLTSLLEQLQSREKVRNQMMEKFRAMMTALYEEIENSIMIHQNTIAKLQKKHDAAQARKLHWENEYSQALSSASEKTMQEGKLRMAARNMYVIVRTRMGRPITSMDFCEQMTHVHNYMSDLKKIIAELSREESLRKKEEERKEKEKQLKEGKKN